MCTRLKTGPTIKSWRLLILLIAFWLYFPIGLTARADQAAPPTPSERQAELRAAWSAAVPAATWGPARVKLLDQASIDLSDDQAFIPAAQTDRIMRALGNGSDRLTYGLIVSRRSDAHWMILIRWINDGYVRDGDAKDWQADVLLQNLRESTEIGNQDRARMGLPALDIVGWVEPPTYDGNAHRLVWSLAAREHDAPTGQPQTVNYNTYALGRTGYFSLNLITDSSAVTTDKLVVRQLLSTLHYSPGKRYQDFDESTDRVATYGLAALIGAVAVKKLGLLALTGLFFVKMWKLCLVAVVGATAAIRRFLNRPAQSPERP